ncbi:hypothetical protein ACFX2F_039791 [Malus domestica]
MDNNFTFCQVGPPGNQDDHETNKLTSDIESITIKDGLSNGTSSNENRGVLWQGGLPGGATSKKQEIVGSLSVSVIDASSMKKKSEVPKQLKSGDAGNSVKPATRAKVPFEKGYSQMDWLKLTRTHPDLAGT